MSTETDGPSFEIVAVQSGARSLRSLEFCETFHPVIGPMAEALALHVRQQRLIERACAISGNTPFVIWDVGLGAAANAIAVIEAFRDLENGARVELHSFDQTTAPLAFALRHAGELGYLAPHVRSVEELIARGECNLGALAWHFHAGDFREKMKLVPAPHAVLYDPYSPRANPAMWTLEHFTKMRARLRPDTPCLLTNYTRSTAVRVTLLLAGFAVGCGHATGEKDETTIASNDLRLLAEPLDARWLERVRRSTRAAPLRLGDAEGAILPQDFRALAACPQFAAAP